MSSSTSLRSARNDNSSLDDGPELIKRPSPQAGERSPEADQGVVAYIVILSEALRQIRAQSHTLSF